MGIIDTYMTFPDQMLPDGGRAVRVLLRPDRLAALVAEQPQIPGCTLLTDQALPDHLIADALVRGVDILTVEVDTRDAPALTRLADLRARHPALPVIAAVEGADLHSVRALMKLGINDVVELPLFVPTLAASIRDIVLVPGASSAPKGNRGALISVIKSIGGVGATNVANQIGSALARAPGLDRGACLFDLDVQFGNVVTYLGLPSEPSLTELLGAGVRMDGDFFRSVVSTMDDGLAVVPAPDQIGPLEAIDADQLLSVLECARREYGALVVDMPSNWSNWTLSVVAQSDLIVLVVNLSIGSLRQGRRQLELLASQGIGPDRIRVVANRVEKKLFRSISLDDAARALGVPVSFSIQNDYPLVNGANDRGMLVHQVNPKARTARDFEQAGAEIAALVAAKVN